MLNNGFNENNSKNKQGHNYFVKHTSIYTSGAVLLSLIV